jgi:sugar phosphate isomerase/epimerase
LAFSTLAFPSQSLETVVSLGRGWGYDGVELRLLDGELIDPAMPAAERDKVKRTVEKADLPIIAVDSSIRLTDEAPGAELTRFLELANAWEAPVVRVFGGSLPDDDPARAERLKTAAGVLEAAVPLAERLGVSIGVETHDSFSASKVVAELLALAPSPWVGAVWDSHHPHRMAETPAEIYTNIGERLVLAQVKDARRSDTEKSGWQLVLLDEGEVPVHEMLTILADHNYDGWISVEWEKKWHPEIEEPEVALPQHLALLQQWMSK